MERRFRAVVAAASAAILVLLVAACGADLKPVEDRVGTVERDTAAVQARVGAIESRVGKLSVPAREVEFVVTGVELKGSTSVDSLAPPPTDPTTLSDGYRYKKPGDADKADAKKWEVATYVWSPGAMTVLQGDRLTLRVFIVNGDKHTAWVEGPDGAEVVKEGEQNRGREYVMTFTAAQVGTYKLVCNEHDPTMRAVITVLPRT